MIKSFTIRPATTAMIAKLARMYPPSGPIVCSTAGSA